MKRMIQQYLTRILGMLALTAGILTSCAIENDIPYPIIEASIESMTVEGQRGADQNTFTAATIKPATLLWRMITYYSVILITAPFSRITKKMQQSSDSA